MVHQADLTLSMLEHGDMQNITERVAEVVRASGVTTGIVQLFVLGSTAALGIIEFEPGLRRDFPEMLDRLIPPSRDYAHEQTWFDGNGHSHLQATLQGPSLTVPITNGKLNLGTWQQTVLIECAIEPRQRRVIVTVYGE